MNAAYSSVRRVYVRHGTKQALNFSERRIPHTSVNIGELWSLSRGLVSPSCLLAQRCNPLETWSTYLGYKVKHL